MYYIGDCERHSYNNFTECHELTNITLNIIKAVC